MKPVQFEDGTGAALTRQGLTNALCLQAENDQAAHPGLFDNHDKVLARVSADGASKEGNLQNTVNISLINNETASAEVKREIAIAVCSGSESGLGLRSEIKDTVVAVAKGEVTITPGIPGVTVKAAVANDLRKFIVEGKFVSDWKLHDLNTKKSNPYALSV